MKEPAASDENKITMTQCQNTVESRKMFCNKRWNADEVQIGWKGRGQNRRFLQLLADSQQPSYAISINVSWINRQFWKSHQLCDDVTNYEGNI